jgi:hypothetical protein
MPSESSYKAKSLPVPGSCCFVSSTDFASASILDIRDDSRMSQPPFGFLIQRAGHGIENPDCPIADCAICETYVPLIEGERASEVRG